MNKLAIALSAALTLGAAASAHAADATITFTGKVVASTCSVHVSTGSNTVALRQINAGAFKGDPSVGSTPFRMTLKAGSGTATCAKDKARLIVDQTASDINADGMITDTAGGTGTRTNALVKFLDADNGDAAIDLTKRDDPALQRDKDTGEFKYNWIARYHAPGGAALTEGDFSGRLVFDIDNY
ncbi:type 1 fimbrial protein [Stenotrophomonas maltophilia]|uniref:fimbrial protein n=1 Tax=Stenotrophomonas TaxID=40323 RepID=UPI000D427FDB|nr:fimbrial protein [Stenotrophomonas maltophilia]MBA0224342.1 type 1 fimbrial protein [Stenotrophomonas maltophilia]MBA0365573.1 type 1 fimbrial protein [Stenotrophomonas maltophilia]MBA0402806.1 type 1 fimbrial protein [Stenotrophomonas maltophilia]MCF3521554.1 fimbrial protein [Stenotrophomonas maltophilia]PSD14109.1 hypothetical protein C7E14_13475 [Stenotrophomonas maltophilia]